AQKRRIITDVLLPFPEVVDPIIESCDFFHGLSFHRKQFERSFEPVKTLSLSAQEVNPSFSGTSPITPPCPIRASARTNTFLSRRRCPFGGRFALPTWRLRK